jgi:transposase
MRFAPATLSSVRLQLHYKNEFPGKNGVIVMDNCRIRYNGDLIVELKELYNVRVEFLPPYSLDLNPIEEASRCRSGRYKRTAIERRTYLRLLAKL